MREANQLPNPYQPPAEERASDARGPGMADGDALPTRGELAIVAGLLLLIANTAFVGGLFRHAWSSAHSIPPSQLPTR